MCLAVPMKIVQILPEAKARVKQDELESVVDICLVEEPKVGDYLIIHAGYAIQVLDLEEAEDRLKLFREVAEAGQQGLRKEDQPCS